jgi:hypothetical protein
VVLADRVERIRMRLTGRWLRFASYRRLQGTGAIAATPQITESGQLDELVGTWFRRQRGGGPFRMLAGHAFTDWWTRFEATHPEFFAVQPDGSRTPYPSPQKAKLDVTNPAVARQWLSDVEHVLRRAPHLTMFSASENDGAYSGYCMSAECRAWDAPDGPRVRLAWKSGEREYVAMTDRYVKFWNRLAHLLRERFPLREYRIGVWAYGALRTPPVRARPDPRIVVGFVGGLAGDGDTQRQADRALWKRWSELVPWLVWRPNLFHYRWGLPASMATRLGEDFRFLAAHHLVGIDIDTVHHDWATRGFDYYLLAQLAWDPGVDVDELRSDYCRRAFGPTAGPDVERYLVALEESESELVNRVEGKSRYEAVDVYGQHFSEKRLAGWAALLTAARIKVTDASSPAGRRYLARLDFLQLGLDFTRAQVDAIRALEALRSRRVPMAVGLAEARAAVSRRDRQGEAAGRVMAIGWPQWAAQMRAVKMERYLLAPSP